MKFSKKLGVDSDFLLKSAFVFFGLIPLSSYKLESVLSVLFIFLLILSSIRTNNKDVYVNKRAYVLNASLFLVLLLTLKDGIDILTFKKLEQMFSLFAFPIAFFILSKQGFKKNKFLLNIWKKTFVFSSFILCFFCFFLISKYSNPKYLELDSNFFHNAIKDNPYFSRHPAYISMYLNVSILITVNWLFEAKNKVHKMFYLLVLITLSTLLLMLSVKIAIIGLIISLDVLLFLKIKSKKRFLITQFSVLLFFLAIVSLPEKFNRFSKVFNSNVLNENTRYNSIFVHKQTILCSVKIFQNNLIYGIGIENSAEIVNNCVREIFLFDKEIEYNSHNQYLSYGLHAGFLGVFVLCLVLFLALRNSFLNETILFVLLLYFCVIFLTENVLERQSGILLFSFILNIIPNIKDFKTMNKDLEPV